MATSIPTPASVLTSALAVIYGRDLLLNQQLASFPFNAVVTIRDIASADAIVARHSESRTGYGVDTMSIHQTVREVAWADWPATLFWAVRVNTMREHLSLPAVVPPVFMNCMRGLMAALENSQQQGRMLQEELCGHTRKVQGDLWRMQADYGALSRELIVAQRRLRKARGRVDGLVACRICYSPRSEAHVTACGHPFCKDCITTWSSNTQQAVRHCPVCRQPSSKEDLRPLYLPVPGHMTPRPSGMPELRTPHGSSHVGKIFGL